MGLLDDAIREHLDLKRRRGGDPAEIARAEQEALGPVRREREPASEAPAAEEMAPHAAVEQRHDDAHASDQDRDHPDVDEHVGADEPDPAQADDDAHDHADEPQHEPAPDPRHTDIVHQPTTEFRVEDHHDDEDDEPFAPTAEAHAEHPAHTEHGEGDEDVLEETPDFLQETPEHDRLWFEQRPPRDFDFDG